MKTERQVTKKTIRIGGVLYEFSKPRIMGILNATPDSFFKHSRLSSAGEDVLRKAGQMIEEGADILDIGGYSTRPGAEDVGSDEECERILPVIRAIKDRYPGVVISVDTFRAVVAKEALKAGAEMVNDVSGGTLDEGMFDFVAEAKVPYVLMHMRGTPADMITKTDYTHLLKDIIVDLQKKIAVLRGKDVSDIIVDPGFGFAKRIPQNFELLRGLSEFSIFDCPLLVGVSRKGMIWRTLEISPEDALNGTTVLHTVALQQGADILRVHDVKAAGEVIRLFEHLYP